MTVLGAGLLWFGWFGFNAGSALTAGGLAASAFIVTNTAAAAATITWVGASYLRTGKVSVVGAAGGAVAGLVAITPASGFVTPAAPWSSASRPAASATAPRCCARGSRSRRAGRVRGPRCRRHVRCRRDRRVRDAADPGGLQGPDRRQRRQIGTQLIAVGATIALRRRRPRSSSSSSSTSVLGIRVPPRRRGAGLDLAVHGEAAYQV